MTPTLTALLGYALWFMALSLMIAGVRVALVLQGKKAANDFNATGEDIGGFSVRLARAHANTFENLPAFAAIALAAVVSGQGAVMDPYAMWILYARLAQSVVHMASTSVIAVNLRFALYLVQIVLLAMVAIGLLSGG